jgi:hypothetical protein
VTQISPVKVVTMEGTLGQMQKQMFSSVYQKADIVGKTLAILTEGQNLLAMRTEFP